MAPSREDTVRAVERRLVNHPDFGLSATISARVVARYDFALDILADRLPALAELVTTLRADAARWTTAVLRDPVVRKAIEDSIVRLVRDSLEQPDPLERVLGHATGHLAEHPDLMPTQAEQLGGPYAGPPGWIWLPALGAPAEASDELGELGVLLADTFRAQFPSGTVRGAGQGTVEHLERAGQLLTALLPDVGPDALRQIAACGLVESSAVRRRPLAVSDALPGMIVLQPGGLDDPWDAARRLLHEGLRLKLLDIMRCASLVADHNATDQVPWRRAPWDMRRCLAAFHAYCHLVVLQASERGNHERLATRFGPPRRGTGSGAGPSDAVVRVAHLGKRLSGPLSGYLTPDGRRMVRWLRATVAPLLEHLPGTPNPSAPAPLGTVRYLRDPTLRLRPAPELGCLFAYRPQDRTLHCLNLAAWSVLELCRGQRGAELDLEYAALVRSKLTPAQASRQLQIGLARLEAGGLIRRVESGRKPAENPGR